MEIESKQQILEWRKEIERELVEMLKETEIDFTLDHIRDVIYHEEDNDDMMKAVAMFDRGGDASELSKSRHALKFGFTARQFRNRWANSYPWYKARHKGNQVGNQGLQVLVLGQQSFHLI